MHGPSPWAVILPSAQQETCPGHSNQRGACLNLDSVISSRGNGNSGARSGCNPGCFDSLGPVVFVPPLHPVPDSWLAILRRVTGDGLRGSEPFSRKINPSAVYRCSGSFRRPKGFLMEKLWAYRSRGSSSDVTLPSSHSLYSIMVGKILETLAILPPPTQIPKEQTSSYSD